jgi:thymidine phosphorylase
MYSSYDQLSKYTRNQDSTVQASILSSRLANEHQMLLMNVSLPEGVDSSMEIKELTEALKSLINSANMKEVIFD